MAVTASTLCLILAVALFAVATLGFPTGRFSLVAGGLFFLSLSLLLHS